MSRKRTGQKRGNGEGTVSFYPKRGQQGEWCSRIMVNGKRIAFYGKTRHEAVSKTSAAKLDYSAHEHVPCKIFHDGINHQGWLDGALYPGKKAVTLEQIMASWVNGKEKSLRPSTFRAYQGLIRKHISGTALGQSWLEGTKDNRLTTDDLAQHYADRLEKGSAPKTVRNLHFIIKGSLSWAKRFKHIDQNPADDIIASDLPKVHKRKREVLSALEARRLLDVAAGTKSEGIITMCLFSCARIGEIMGLTWDDLIFEDDRGNELQEPVMHITKSLQYTNKQPKLVLPKTYAGIRTLAISKRLLKAIRRHRSSQNAQALKLKSAWSNKLNLVFTNEIGRPLNRHAVLRQYVRPMLTKAGLPPIRTHDLRHLGASLLLSEGVPVPDVSKVLGHADSNITMSTYAHALPNTVNKIANKMDQLLGA